MRIDPQGADVALEGEAGEGVIDERGRHGVAGLKAGGLGVEAVTGPSLSQLEQELRALHPALGQPRALLLDLVAAARFFQRAVGIADLEDHGVLGTLAVAAGAAGVDDGPAVDVALGRALDREDEVDAQGAAVAVGEAIKGLEGVYVRVFNFDNENEWGMSEIDSVREQLKAPGWEKLAKVRSRKNDQKVDVFTMFTGDDISGIAVVLTETKKLALVNVIGPIDIDTLVELSGNLNIPELDLIIDGGTKTKKKKKDGN